MRKSIKEFSHSLNQSSQSSALANKKKTKQLKHVALGLEVIAANDG